jgi:hypothetical protein
MVYMMTPKRFPLGTVVMTPGARDAFTGDFLQACLARHAAGDWGTLDPMDRKANDQAVRDGSQILSSYQGDRDRLWIITDAGGAVTTMLLPDEY